MCAGLDTKLETPAITLSVGCGVTMGSQGGTDSVSLQGVYMFRAYSTFTASGKLGGGNLHQNLFSRLSHGSF